MKTIITKYHGPTDYRGSCYSAAEPDGAQVTVSANYSLSAEDNHRAAALALLAKMEWPGNLIGGDTKDGMVWVFAPLRDVFPTQAPGLLFRRAFPDPDLGEYQCLIPESYTPGCLIGDCWIVDANRNRHPDYNVGAVPIHASDLGELI